MAQAYKILGQQNPSATTLTDLYTVPAATEAICRGVIVANRSATATSFRVSVAANGAADSNEQYIAYDVPIAGNEVKETFPVALDATDKIRVYATLATLSFTAMGVEIT